MSAKKKDESEQEHEPAVDDTQEHPVITGLEYVTVKEKKEDG